MTDSALTLSIDSRLQDVRLLALAVRGICGPALGDETAALIELAVAEAASNSVLHAYGGRAGHRVEVTVCMDETALTVRVRDQGKPMAPGTLDRHVSMPEPAAILGAGAAESGWGLPMIRAIADHVAYESGTGCNELVMMKQLART